MSCPSDALPATASGARAEAFRLSPKSAFYLQGSITLSFLAGSSAPTPLYPLYQAEWGISAITVTIVFGIYALAVLAALLVVGRLSDHIGRKPVLLAATAAQALTMIVFTTADGVSGLLLARVIQGFATGAAVAAVGAGLLDLDKARGASANAVFPMLGTASGAMVAGLLVRYLPEPTHLVYWFLAAIFVLQGIGVIFMAETGALRDGALGSLKPQLRLPASVRGPLFVAVPALIATWSLAGFYGSLGPSLVRSLSGSDSSLLAGLALFVLAGSGGLSVLFMKEREPRVLMTVGALALFAGVALTLTGLTQRMVPLFFIGTAIAGAGFGAGLQGAVRGVVPFAAPAERAGVLSLMFVVSYLAMGLPAVMAGYLVVHEGNVFRTAQEFGAVVMILATLALIGAMRSSKEATRHGLEL